MKQQRRSIKKFSIRMQKKLVVLFVLVLLAFAGLSFRLSYIVKEKETKYQKKVFSQQGYDSTTLPFRRGDIVDAKGTKLATSEKVYNLVIDAAVMLYKEDYLEPTLQALGNCFPQLDMTAVREYVSQHPNSSWYVPLKRLSFEEISGFKDMQSEDDNIKGVWFEEEYKRVYPGGSLAADAIGFTQIDNVGQYGMEEYYNDVLNGANGREYGYLNDDLAVERTVKPASDGNTVHSTIDANIQGIVEKYLKQFNDEYAGTVREGGNGAENTGCIIMEVNTGNILAMASYPTFDLNDVRNTQAMLGSNLVEEITNANGYQEIRKTTTIINEEVLASLSDEQIYLNLNNLWKNFCITNTYEPGSVMKPFTVAAALESGCIAADSSYECTGSLEVGGHTIHCHNTYGDGTVSLEQAVALSCNVAMMKIGQTMGRDIFCDFQRDFNFGLKTNVDLAGEARTASLVKEVQDMDAADLATYTFGQNFNVTMVQMITGFCSLINGGYYYEPHIVDKITNSGGAVVKNIEPRVLKQTISNSTSEYIRKFCTSVVTEGTGKTARPAGYMIGGKTGTAQTFPRGNREYVVSFMGFAPADNPQIAVYVVVDRANAAGQDDAKYATRIVRNILTEVLPYLNIFMTEELSEKELQELEERQLANTLQYGKKEDEEETPEESEEPQTEENGTEPGWMRFPIDPDTGYRRDPDTGALLDPDTGDPIEGNNEPIGPDVAAPPEITGSQE